LLPSECLVYYVNDGVTLLGSDPLGDIQLSGPDMRPRHAVFTYSSPSGVDGNADGLIHLCPVDGAVTYLNGKLLEGDLSHEEAASSPGGSSASLTQPSSVSRTRPVLLCHNARIVFGRHHVFRFEQPLAAARCLPEDKAQRRADRKADRRTLPPFSLVPGSGEDTNGEGTTGSENGDDRDVVNGRSVESLAVALADELLSDALDAPTTDAVLDWDFALRELLTNSPDAPLVNPDGRSASQRSSSRRCKVTNTRAIPVKTWP